MGVALGVDFGVEIYFDDLGLIDMGAFLDLARKTSSSAACTLLATRHNPRTENFMVGEEWLAERRDARKAR
jgi:hypothetical protein